MEPNAETIGQLMQYLLATLNPEASVRQQAEAFLTSIEGQPGYGPVLMHCTATETADPAHAAGRQVAAVTFKNMIKKYWPDTDDGSASKINAQDRAAIKAQVVDCMVRLPDRMQQQFAEAIALIGKTDFRFAPGADTNQWPELIPYMVAQWASGDFNVINGVLQTANSLLESYCSVQRTDALFTEINYVLSAIAEPLTNLFAATIQLTQQHAANPEALKTLFHSLTLISKLFYSLNFQDLPEFFEDHMPQWFEQFLQLLSMPEIPALVLDEDKPGMVEQLKAQICENVSLYTMKYDEEFQPYVGKFVEAIWGLLVTTDSAMRNDQLSSIAMKFLSNVSERENYKELFGNEGTLQQICEKIVVPNMSFRECDEEIFEDDYEEYIRRDIEGSDIDTRRRGASDLVRGLCKFFEGPVIQIFSSYIQQLLAQAASGPDQWKAKDAAIFLVTSLAVKGKVQGKGATVTTEHINIVDFFQNTILPDLQLPDVNASSVLKADGIKFALTFRNKLSKEQHMAILPSVVNHLTAENLVVVSYAAYYIERVFIMKVPGQGAMFAEADVAQFAQQLLTNLFAAMQRDDCADNEYIMKAIMRVISVGKTSLTPVIAMVIEALSTKMLAVANNPGKARFNHYMFESMSCAVRFTCEANPATVANFEQFLFPPFETMLTINDVGIPEFQPYVFQILAQMLEVHSVGDITPPYAGLFPFLTQPALWESRANSSPLVRLLQAYMSKGAATLLADESQVEGLLGIFQKLCTSKTYDKEGFKLLGTMIETLTMERMAKYIPTVFQICFARLTDQKMKTMQFMRYTLWMVCLLVGKAGGSFVVQTVDSIQPGLFKMLMTRLTSEVDSLPGIVERKIVSIGLTKLLTETQEMHSTYVDLWPAVVSCLVKIFEVRATNEGDEENQLADLESKGYQAAFAKLAYSARQDHDPFADIANPQQYFSQQLVAVGQQMPGQLGPRIASTDPQVQQCVQKYMQASGIGALP